MLFQELSIIWITSVEFFVKSFGKQIKIKVGVGNSQGSCHASVNRLLWNDVLVFDFVLKNSKPVIKPIGNLRNVNVMNALHFGEIQNSKLYSFKYCKGTRHHKYDYQTLWLLTTKDNWICS